MAPADAYRSGTCVQAAEPSCDSRCKRLRHPRQDGEGHRVGIEVVALGQMVVECRYDIEVRQKTICRLSESGVNTRGFHRQIAPEDQARCHASKPCALLLGKSRMRVSSAAVRSHLRNLPQDQNTHGASGVLVQCLIFATIVDLQPCTFLDTLSLWPIVHSNDSSSIS